MDILSVHLYTQGVRKINATKFKQECLALLDRVEPEGIIITKRGKPVARLLPLARDSGWLIGCLKGKLKIHGDIRSTRAVWDAES